MASEPASPAETTTGLLGAVWDFGSKVNSIWSDYYGAQANADMQKVSADMKRWGAKQRLSDAESATRHAGEVQRAGEEAGVNRLLRLGREIGNIYAGAAGGGIEVSSNTLRHVDRAARLMAYRDVEATNRTAAQQAGNFTDAARASRMAYVGDMTSARLQDISANYAKKISSLQRGAGMLSAAEGFALKSAATIFAAL